MDDKRRAAYDAIDAANAADPNRETVDGASVPAALVYGQRMSAELAALEDAPSDALAIACRAQHIRRWEIPRTDFPTGLVGYKKWRATLARFHAECASAIALEVGYDEATANRVSELVRKLRLATDPEVQTLEDAAANVFLRFHFEDFAAKHPDEKVIDILRKTMAKMSERGLARAGAIELPDRLAGLLTAAASG